MTKNKTRKKKPRMGEYRYFGGTQYQVYTPYGWAVVDNKKELDEKLREIDSFLKTNRGRK